MLSKLLKTLTKLFQKRHVSTKQESDTTDFKYYVGIVDKVHSCIANHLLSRAPNQEEVCMVMYRLGAGESRMHILLSSSIDDGVLMPTSDLDRELRGDVMINGDYIRRCAREAQASGCGLILMHSHPLGKGPQDMSSNDYATERDFAPVVEAITGKPLVGMTLSGDRKWSGRVWLRGDCLLGDHKPQEIVDFRVVGSDTVCVTQKLRNAIIMGDSSFNDKIQVSVASYGDRVQNTLSNIKIGIVGLGSVGSAVAESLVRLGVRNLLLCDHDIVKMRNLDRLTNVCIGDVGKTKVSVIAKRLRSIGVLDSICVESVESELAYGNDAFRKVLDCDLIFCCVDKKDARHNLDRIAFHYLLPVIETGLTIIPDEEDGKIVGLEQALTLVHTLLPGFKCLQCLGQCSEQEQYIATDNPDYRNRGRENIFPISVLLASLATLNMIHLISGERPQSRLEVLFVRLARVRTEFVRSKCNKRTCVIAGQIGLGDDGN